MKKLIPLFILMCAFFTGLAQPSTATGPVYKQFPQVPDFKIALAKDSSLFSKAMLKKKKNVIFFMFSPDCKHCQDAVAEFKSKADLFKKSHIVMVSARPFEETKHFYNSNGLAAFKNVTVGIPTDFYLNQFFDIEVFPSVFVYNKKGLLVKEFLANAPWAQIAEATN